MTRRLLFVGLAASAVGCLVGVGVMSVTSKDDVEAAYHRLWSNVSETEAFGRETYRKPDIVRLIVNHDADGSPLFRLALVWRRPGKTDILSTEGVATEQAGYRLWYGISYRYRLGLEMNLPPHD